MRNILTEESKLYLSKLWPLFALVIVLPLVSYFVWLVFPEKNLEIVVLDKTVPSATYQEHQSIFWTIEHLKFSGEAGEYKSADRDYFGFHPDDSDSHGRVWDFSNWSEGDIQKKAKELDVLYLADTYGVYSEDFNSENSQGISEKIYGGLDRSDISLIRESIAQKKTIIAEFNTMASPTRPGIRAEFENLMGLKWTGWIARYFDEMDTTVNQDLPNWLVQQYVDQHENTWVPNGPGLVFVHENGQVEVFSNSIDYEGETPMIRTQQFNQHGFKLPELVPYPDWFDIILIEREYQVISYYDISPTTLGQQKLRDMGLPRFFPAAVVRDLGEGQHYYFAGDFADLRNSAGSARFMGLPVFWRGFYLVTDYTDRRSFFWNYYYPLLSQVLERAYQAKDH
ncbi:hypothetical protein PBT90_10005 [Algoriphagus halophytocola]|uniref:Uncharacterized protein n=1 Tax=Algoriphagus halophytocola TaxID=2991499 RepID=A0ABY6MIV3_9BACT|nr:MULTISPECIES: hypothetical protein [unclassified Algoriphagus]UZD23721.1 hypothetical protein OM944_04335 [Algoriphagus sp. TR-M5]WBL45015.1 hypothetical protein PBT90_10005 [Algoriphagus sp. TR-M9]